MIGGRHIGTTGGHRAVVLALVAAASLTIGISGAAAGRIDPPGRPDGNHCINAFGVDLNVVYGIPDQFRTRDCRVVSAGEHWIRPLWWFTNFASDSVYPPGYVPSDPDPLDDFVAKLISVKVVVDPGTPNERTHVFEPGQFLRTDIDTEELVPGAFGAAYPQASMLPRLRPLSVGDHQIEMSLTLRDVHCDGFTTDAAASCLAPGEVAFVAHPVTVTTPDPAAP